MISKYLDVEILNDFAKEHLKSDEFSILKVHTNI